MTTATESLPHVKGYDVRINGENGYDLKYGGNEYDIKLDSGNAVRNTVRNMVSNLENVITNLHGIVGDLRILVYQIDVVTKKIDGRYGNQWKKPKARHINHTEENKTTSKIIEVDSSEICSWKKLMDKYECPEFSSDIDWSYLGLTGLDGVSKNKDQPPKTKRLHPRRIRRIRAVNPALDSSGVSTECEMDTDHDVPLSSGSDVRFGTGSDLKLETRSDVRFDSLEFEDHSSGHGCTCKTYSPKKGAVPMHAYCQEITGKHTEGSYCGVYESIMESELEDLSNCDDQCNFSDAEDDLLSVTSSEFRADYDRRVNPWTSFGMVHIDSTHESDDVSESASDILNDNYIETKYINPGFDDGPLILAQSIC